MCYQGASYEKPENPVDLATDKVQLWAHAENMTALAFLPVLLKSFRVNTLCNLKNLMKINVV